MNIIEYADRELAAIDLANVIAGDLESALFTHDRASLAVPGGTTPGPIFDVLCAADLDWSRVHVFATDERWVPQNDPRSNAGLIASRLLTGRAAAATLLPFYAPAQEPESVLPEIEAQLAPELPVSVLLLGMGVDMHTASLFPGVAGLAEALSEDAPVLSVLRPEGVPETRVSLSAWVLNGAMSKHLVIFGADKRAALERARKLSPEEAPVRAVLDEMTIHWAE
ncbi:6-phosphogluconolactonase [Sedimentitalea todarodis]|uniref:6-phosphogluconolactonase n=1 Tax=Sedimentitalea todarodis TaxID=1631240 RepID=A0ABU3VCF7_9RHOB|nr:6-phosphogluconolactonase [Sedimentitalea todarodis]MDU9003856.1 6-phosphogluconolactonase [Sedimentitalea todarodis]